MGQKQLSLAQILSGWKVSVNRSITDPPKSQLKPGPLCDLGRVLFRERRTSDGTRGGENVGQLTPVSFWQDRTEMEA